MLALAVLAAVAGAAVPSPVGRWLAILPGGPSYPAGCDGDAPLLLDADGRYIVAGDTGEWTLRGDRLTLLTTEPSTIFADVRVGQRRVHRLRMAGAEEMWLDGVRHRLCPPR